jgi:hypothetical protein
VVECPSRWDDGATVVTDQKYGTRYRIEPDVVTVMRNEHAPRSRAGVMRVVREVATALALADGSQLQLHAAALEHRGRIVVLAGPKEAGKTTLVARLASVGKLGIAGNDRLLVTPSDDPAGGWRVRPIPTIVNVRATTQALLPALFGDVPAVPAPAHLTTRELDAVPVEHGAHDPVARLKLSPTQFARAVGASLCGEGELTRVLLISVDTVLDGFAIEPLNTAAARAQLEGARYGFRRDGTPRTIFEDWLGVARPSDADQVLLDGLAESAVVSTVRVGPRVLHDDGVATDLLNAALAYE